MSSNDRIILLTGGDNFEITGEKVDEIPFRNKITITNSVALANGPRGIIPSNFTLKSTTDYQDLYVDFTTSGLCFKIPSKNMLIRVNQRDLNLTKKAISNLTIHYDCANLNGVTSSASAYSSEFIEYSNTSGIIRYLHCIPECYYINMVSRITIATDAMTIPAGKLTIDFFQF